MPHKMQVRVAEAEVSRRFSDFADLALTNHVIVTRNGHDRNVILSIDEYHRLIGRSRTAYRAGDTPEVFMERIDRLIETLPEE